jgi:hypothetical protein
LIGAKKHADPFANASRPAQGSGPSAQPAKLFRVRS